MYKLIALDMDGTLLDKNNIISKENQQAIKKAKDKGVKIVLATGRTLKGIKPYLEELDITDGNNYCVTCNGSIVINSSTNEIITKVLLNYEDLLYLYKLSKKLNIYIHALTTSNCITPICNKYTKIEANMNRVSIEEVDFNTISGPLEIIKILFVGPEEKISLAINTLPKEVYDKYTVVRSYPYFLEFMHKEVNKGTGVESLAKKLHIKPSEIICVGDAENDLHMIKYAGLGVAMENAFPNVKKAADYITYSNNESGVAHVINKFIL
ncbi:sugar-phosphatase [Clostridium sp.]|jgi:Cof subfamily protein (haloacid dehalogenase superfamily)|uniref:sugar-phosphatase n=1 Tax=Clostridium sp. TaxID=1506 RepID=UPI0039F46B7B